MRQKKGWKKMGVKVLAALTAMGLLWQPSDINAAAWGRTSDSYTANGTFHIDQFGEYDINAEVTVTDGVITAVEITGENFGGTYGDYNQSVKLPEAIAGMAEKFIGLGDTDRDGIQELDAVSGATYSSNGIKEAVMNALGLEEEETSGNVPSQVPEAGTYQVTVAVRSDVVDHSLVQTDTTQAVLQVDDNGQMKLSYTMVSGTDQEPMYILGVNGYYVKNDRSGTLSMDGVVYNTAQAGDYTVVTDVTYPLSGLSQYYYTNTSLYVPAMSNLNGEINGIYFENGHFSVDTIATVYWDTLTKQGNSSMEITANVAENISAPSYGVSVPSSLAMGGLSTRQDNIKPYEIKISAEDKDGLVTVTAPDQGNLKNDGEESLRFYNDFGTQIFNASDGSVSTETEAARANTLKAAQTEESSNIKTDTGSTEGGTPLYGNILISAADVSGAAPGNYTGTTTFTISYSESGEDPDNPGGEDPDNPGGEDPDTPGGEDPDNPDSEDGGQDQNMEAGRYTVDVALWHATNNTLSMGNAALNPQGVIVVDKDGNMSLQMTFQSLNISGIEGYLYRMKKVDMSTVVYNQYHFPSSYEAEDAQILETFEGIYDSFNDPDSPSYDANTGGNEYPRIISIPIEPEEDMNYVEIYVPVMESIGAGQGTQLARLHINWDSVEKISDDPGTEDPGIDDPGTEEPGTEDPGTDEPDGGDPDDGSALDIRNLDDGVYALTGRMVKVDKTTLSMSDNAINHTIKLTVADGKYDLTLDFRGLTIGDRRGYLSELKYYLTGYTLDEYGNPVGDLADVTIDSYQTNEDGSLVSDQYGTDYPDFVTFEMIPEALEDGYVPLQVFVPIMESIAAGTGNQPVFLSLDWSTIKKTSEDDPDFDNDADGGDENNNGNDSNNGNGNNNGTTAPTGGSGLTGGSSLNGGSSLTGGSSLGSSSLGNSSLGSGSSLKNGLSTASGAKTGDETDFAYVWLLLLAGGVTAACVVRIRYNRRK